MRKLLLATTVVVAFSATPARVNAATTYLITPSQGSLTDKAGNIWTITASGSIMEGNQYTPGGGGTLTLAMGADGVIYGEDANGKGWFALSGNGQYWSSTPDPSPSLETASAAVPTTAIASTVAATPAPAAANCSAAPAAGTNALAASLIPPGYLHTSGSQIVDAAGEPVRIASVGAAGGQDYSDTGMQKILLAGFNAFRISFYNASINDDLSHIDALVAQATKFGIKVIIDHHADEGDGNCASQQANGLWFDAGPGTNNTDGCGASGTVSQRKFLQDWLTVAQRYAGNPTVIGYDLDNEPLEIPGASTWGDGSVTDLRAMYQTVGNAILAVNPGPLIIAEGPIVWQPLYQADLTHVASMPVALNVPNKVVYSAHLYPTAIGGEPVDSGAPFVNEMQAAWGYLISGNIAPVWIGELGASLDGQAEGNLADELAWAATVIPYLNGTSGALSFNGGQQAVSTDWWAWGVGEIPDGTLDGNGNLKQGQWAVYSQFVQKPICGGAYAAPAALTITVADAQNAVDQAEQIAVAQAPANAPDDPTPAPSTVSPAVATMNQSAQQTVNQADVAIQQATARLQAIRATR